jgi:hypothetical protein
MVSRQIDPRMEIRTYTKLAGLLAMCTALLAQAPSAWGQANKYRGLWVGQVTLNAVNEVPIALDQNDRPVAPDPAKPTPTFDQAHLRIILHVNGAGQVSLLKDVAVLNRKIGNTTFPGSDVVQSESDIALVTDERLYPEFPKQAAIRYASAVFDFGESRATDVLTAVVNEAVKIASEKVNLGFDAANSAAKAEALKLVNGANVKPAYDSFLLNTLTAVQVNLIAETGLPNPSVDSAALDLALQAPFYDTRAKEAIAAIKGSVSAAPTPAEKQKVAHNTAASFADLENKYQRFISGKIFGDMLMGAAESAAAAAVVPGATISSIRIAVNGNQHVVKAKSDALTYRISLYTDTRSSTAVTIIAEAIIASAVTALNSGSGGRELIRMEAEDAGRKALALQVPRYPVSPSSPTAEYNTFVTSAGFKNSAAVAAEAGAKAAVKEKEVNTLYTAESIKAAALDAAMNALSSVFAAAAQAVRNELPMEGIFAPGSKGLAGTIFLPASHPTNPFMHRRHPDHTRGYDIRRILGLDIDSTAGETLPRAGFGVDRLTGVYREEVFGLHKPLGPDKNIGLRVTGVLELNRVSLIDTLNAL